MTGVARASLEELLLDYEDFLRQRGLALWDKDDPRAQAVRRFYQSDGSDESDEYRAGRNPIPLGELGLCPKPGAERLYRERQLRRGR